MRVTTMSCMNHQKLNEIRPSNLRRILTGLRELMRTNGITNVASRPPP
jgi:hypothetical protein